MDLILLVFAGLYVLGMSFILIYGMAQAHLLYHYVKSKKEVALVPPFSANWPLVTVQLPIYNEQYVVERLLDAVARLDYPPEKLEIQVLDDSTDQTPQLIREKIRSYPAINFQYVHRIDREGFKAGALKAGLKQASGEFVAVFDADFLPESDFIKKTVPYFSKEKVGMVQTRWTHLNENYSLLTRLQAFALDAHFLIEQIGRNRQGAFINFNGTAGIWRKQCILDAGNWEADTLTEDLDLSYRAQKAGWEFVYLPEVHSPAELPPIMSALKSQQFRWTKGGAECAVKHLKSVMKSSASKRIKLHALAHLLNSVVFIAVGLVSMSSIPLWFAVKNGVLPLSFIQWGAVFLFGFVLITAVYFVAHLSTKKHRTSAIISFCWKWPLFLSVSMGMALHNSLAVWEGLTGKKSGFVRTPKFNVKEKSMPWNTNRYLNLQMPPMTYAEGGLALLFWGMVYGGLATNQLLLLPIHLLLAIGYSMVFFESLRSYRRHRI